MKTSKIISGLFILMLLNVSASYAQQQFTHTVTAKNKYCNATCSVIDVPQLNNNPLAVILVTPSAANGRSPGPHSVGAYYVPFLKKWSITNTDGTAIAEGLIFDVKYYSTPDANQFVYVVPERGALPCIDHAGLNANPNAQIRFSPTGSPRGAYFNGNEVRIEYDASALKWCLANVNSKPMPPDTAYNIVITPGSTVGSNTSTLIATPYVPIVGITTLPTPLAPLVVVVRIEWTIPFQTNVALSPGYCRVIQNGYTNPAILTTDSVIVTGHQYGQGANLRWTAEAGNGSLVITACNNASSYSSSSANTHLNDKKINILVLR